MAFVSPFLGAPPQLALQRSTTPLRRPKQHQRRRGRDAICAVSAAPPARGCGWVRRAALNAGRAVKARTGNQCIEWSVPENEVKPTCRLEKLAWEADAAVENGRETMPFATLQGRARQMPLANGAGVAAALRREPSSSAPRVLDGRAPPLVVAPSADIPRLRGEGWGDGVAFVAREVVALPYQVLKVRVKGADGFVLQAAIWPVDDIGYQCKLARVLGMACIVEANTPAQVEALLAGRPGVAGVVLCARDEDELDGDAASFEALFRPFEERLREWGVPVVAEARAGGAPEVEVLLCPGADALLCGLPPL